MTTDLVRPDAMTAPAITPLAGTLLSVASIIESIKWLEPTHGLYDSYNCITTDRQASWPCPRTYLSAPVQAAATTATTGGTVAAGTYLSKITAINAEGETLPSNEISRVTTGATSTITFNWAAVAGATGYKVYVTNAASGTEKLLATVGNVLTYVWTGTPAIGTAVPPTENSAEVFATKDFTDGPEWLDGVRFQVYAGISCKPFGFDGESGLSEVERVFKARESYGIERGIIETVLQGATDLTPAGGAVSPVVGLALLEGDAATKYAGVPTIHTPRSIGTLLFSAYVLHVVGDQYLSDQGSKIASGGGYETSNVSPAGVPAPAGEKWLYASGEVTIARGDIISKTEMDRESNDILALVERPYVTTVDCYKSAVRVKVQ